MLLSSVSIPRDLHAANKEQYTVFPACTATHFVSGSSHPVWTYQSSSVHTSLDKPCCNLVVAHPRLVERKYISYTTSNVEWITVGHYTVPRRSANTCLLNQTLSWLQQYPGSLHFPHTMWIWASCSNFFFTLPVLDQIKCALYQLTGRKNTTPLYTFAVQYKHTDRIFIRKLIQATYIVEFKCLPRLRFGPWISVYLYC